MPNLPVRLRDAVAVAAHFRDLALLEREVLAIAGLDHRGFLLCERRLHGHGFGVPATPRDLLRMVLSESGASFSSSICLPITALARIAREVVRAVVSGKNQRAAMNWAMWQSFLPSLNRTASSAPRLAAFSPLPDRMHNRTALPQSQDRLC